MSHHLEPDRIDRARRPGRLRGHWRRWLDRLAQPGTPAGGYRPPQLRDYPVARRP